MVRFDSNSAALRAVALFEAAKERSSSLQGSAWSGSSTAKGTAWTYACLRFIEAYGLWRNRAWANWVGALSGGIYAPFELYQLYLSLSWLKLAALTINVAVVAHMGRSIRSKKR